MFRAFKIFVLPPLLTLAVVAASLMVFMNYLSLKSERPTYVFASLREARPCAFCHDGFFERSTRRVAALRFRVATP